jgi:hypothetical protein
MRPAGSPIVLLPGHGGGLTTDHVHARSTPVSVRSARKHKRRLPRGPATFSVDAVVSLWDSDPFRHWNSASYRTGGIAALAVIGTLRPTERRPAASQKQNYRLISADLWS